MGPLRWIAAVALGVGLTLTACGGDDDETTDTAPAASGDGQTVTVEARDDLRFHPDELTAKAGTVRIVHENEGGITHSFVIDELDVRIVDDGEETVEAAAGEYDFYCDVAGHREAGMEGVLTVTP